MWSIRSGEHNLIRVVRFVVSFIEADPLAFVFGCNMRIFL